MIVTLVGYRGCGKSSVAPVLASRLGWDHVDADTEIERRSGCTIREIFQNQGEAGFRRIERDVMADLLRRNDLVLAAGGGAVLDDDIRRQLQSAGPVIWLQASIDTILNRIRNDAGTSERRPALTDDDPRSEVESLLAVRIPLYREVAALSVVTDDRSVAEIVNEIIARLPPLDSGEPAG